MWFKPSEVSTACSLGVFGIQLGCALGFLLSPIIVKNHDNIEEVGYDFKVLCWSLTVSVIIPALAVIFCKTGLTFFFSVKLIAFRFSRATTSSTQH